MDDGQARKAGGLSKPDGGRAKQGGCPEKTAVSGRPPAELLRNLARARAAVVQPGYLTRRAGLLAGTMYDLPQKWPPS